jgi:hypothetical protein
MSESGLPSEETLLALADEFKKALDALPEESDRRRLLRDWLGCASGEEPAAIELLFNALKKTARRIAAAAAAGKLDDPGDPQEAIRKGYASDELLTIYVITYAVLFAPGPLKPAPETRPKRPRSEPLPERLSFPADRIHKGAVEGFSFLARWIRQNDFWRGYAPRAKPTRGFSMLMGFRTDPGEVIWQSLLTRGEAAIKAHYALWARLYEQTGGEPGEYAVINVNQFCDDLGYKKHHKGGHRRETKQEAMRLLETLTTIEIVVEYTPPGKNAPTRRIRGELWKRGLIAEEKDQYGDLFGKAREGDPTLWDPVGFTFEPGHWFRDPIWRRHNAYLGQIGAGLLSLRTDKDQTAILIGGYLGTLARFDQYRTRRVRVNTLLTMIGMADRYPKHPQQLLEVVEGGLNKLVAVHVLANWRYTDEDPTEPDMDDPKTLAELADANISPWRKRVIEVVWPEELTQQTPRLEAAQAKARATAKARPKGKVFSHEGGGRPHT